MALKRLQSPNDKLNYHSGSGDTDTFVNLSYRTVQDVPPLSLRVLTPD